MQLRQRSTPRVEHLATVPLMPSWASDTTSPHFLRRSDQRVNRLVTDHNAMLLTAALSGHGIACVPEFWARDHVLLQELVVLLEAETDNRRTVSALRPMGPPLSKTSAFVEFMAVRLAPILEPGGIPEKADLAD
ncbi:LysR substrate-binding domain-containing protein [Bradyrhizobium liaoningense]